MLTVVGTKGGGKVSLESLSVYKGCRSSALSHYFSVVGGKYNGVGTCIWADGRKYHGEWKAGVCKWNVIE